MSDADALPDDPGAAFLALADAALELLDEERVVFLTGEYARVAALTGRKLAVLARLEDVLPKLRRSAELVAALERLVAASRRNEQIIRAARQGIAQARRRTAAIAATGRGAVAYAQDGTRIDSRADLLGAGKSA